MVKLGQEFVNTYEHTAVPTKCPAYSSAAAGVLGDTGKVGEDAALPDGWVVPLDGGRVVKSITCSIGSRTGLAAIIAGMLLGAVLAVTADLWIFVILIPLGLLDYLYDRHQVTQAPRRARRRAGRHARMPGAWTAPAAQASSDEPAEVGIPAAKPPLSPRAAQAAFACYAGLAILLWLFMLAMGHQPGAVAAMHALQG